MTYTPPANPLDALREAVKDADELLEECSVDDELCALQFVCERAWAFLQTATPGAIVVGEVEARGRDVVGIRGSARPTDPSGSEPRCPRLARIADQADQATARALREAARRCEALADSYDPAGNG